MMAQNLCLILKLRATPKNVISLLAQERKLREWRDSWREEEPNNETENEIILIGFN